MKLHGFSKNSVALSALLIAVASSSGALAGETGQGSAAGPVPLFRQVTSEQSPAAALEQIEQPSRTAQASQTTQMGALEPVEGPAARTLRAQHLLTELGFEPGPIDGKMGPKTRAAIRAFQRGHELPDDGALSEGLLVALAQATRADEPAVEVLPLEATADARAESQSLDAEAVPSAERPDKAPTLDAVGLVSSAEAATPSASDPLSTKRRPRGPADAYGLDDAVVESWMIVKSLSGVLFEQIEANIADALH